MPQKVREVIRRLEQEGWVLKTTRGSHRNYVHPGKLNADVPPGTWASIQRQAGWRDDEEQAEEN